MIILYTVSILAVLWLAWFAYGQYSSQKYWYKEYRKMDDESNSWKIKCFEAKFGKNFKDVKHLIKDGTRGTAYSTMSESQYDVKFYTNKGRIGVMFLGRTEELGEVPLFGFDNIDENSQIYGIKINNQ